MAGPRTTNLEPELSPFVGRAEELAGLAQLLGTEHRLVTLLGPGGVGKTRLARTVTLRELSRFPGGAFLVELTEALSVEDVCRCVAQALGLPLQGLRTAEDAVTHVAKALAARGQLLLVLDNFEQIVELAPATAQRWLSLAPQLTLLVTSRERLKLPGEVIVSLGPLSLAAAGDEPSDAVQLFVHRARGVRAGFKLDAGNAGAIGEVVRTLDGIPLAIELAAARMGILSPAQLASKLGSRFEILRTADPAVPDHHRTLRAAIEWSWNLLPAWEQEALAQCSVFHGGFELDAAEEVLRADGAPPALDVVQALQEKSLLRTFAADGAPDELRYSLYESIRELASEKLRERGGEEAVRERHSAFYRKVGSAWADGTRSKDGLRWIRRLALERDNLLAVVRRALERERPGAALVEEALQALVALEPAVDALGPWQGHGDAQLAVLAKAAAARVSGEPVAAALLVRLLVARAAALRLRGRLEESLAAAQEALELARNAKDPALTALALTQAGSGRSLADPAAAALDYDAALALYRELGDEHGEAIVLTSLAYLSHSSGRHAEMDERARAALQLLARAEDRKWELGALNLLGASSLEQGRLGEARGHCSRASAIARERGDRRLLALATAILGVVEQEEGNLEAAAASYEELLRGAREAGDGFHEGLWRLYFGRLLHEQGHLPQAREHYEAGLLAIRAAGNQRNLGLFQSGLAALLAAQDQEGAALTAFEEAEAVLAPLQNPALLAVLELQRGHLDLLTARAAEAKGDGAAALSALETARARATRAELPASEDVRTARRILAAALAAQGTPRPTLVVEREARWFRPPGSDQVTFKRQQALRLILLRLVDEHGRAPGSAVPLQALQAAGWPGEKMSASAAANRIHVAVTTLRKLGLGERLRSSAEGWFLDAGLRVVLAG